MNQTATSGTMGWTVVPDAVTADGYQMFKWTVFTPFGGMWGYADLREEAVNRARSEYVRLTGEEA